MADNPNDPNRDGIGQPVDLLSPRLPWQSPQSLGPGSPHNLPPPLMRPGLRSFQPVSAVNPGASVGPGPAAPVDDRYHYAELNGEQVIAVGVASVSVLLEPSYRRNLLWLRTSGATNIFIAFGSIATTNSILRLASNDMALLDMVVPQDELFAISDAVGGQLTIAVSNYTPGAP